MDKIKINLIPPEIKEKEKKDARLSFINKISLAMLALLILLTSGILSVVIYQGAILNSLNQDLEKEEEKIQSKKDVEAVVRLLKNRIDTINQFSTKKYKQRQVYDLITTLFPESVSIQSIQINKTPSILIQGQTESTRALKNLFDNLTDPNINEEKISSVTIESINKNQVGKISFELTLHLPEGVL